MVCAVFLSFSRKSFFEFLKFRGQSFFWEWKKKNLKRFGIFWERAALKWSLWLECNFPGFSSLKSRLKDFKRPHLMGLGRERISCFWQVWSFLQDWFGKRSWSRHFWVDLRRMKSIWDWPIIETVNVREICERKQNRNAHNFGGAWQTPITLIIGGW